MNKPMRTDIRPHGLSSEHERTLCYLLDCDEDWAPLAWAAWEQIENSIHSAGGLSPGVNYSGYLLPYIAEAVRIGIERGRRLERNPIVDALFSNQRQPANPPAAD